MQIFLSKSSMPLIKYIAYVLGWLMNGIYEVLNKIGLPNVGLAVLFFTIIIYLILTPIQYKTQKSSKIMAALNPELQKIQKKYQGKRDQYSMQKMNEETQALYSRYGVSLAGNCLPMLVQLPLLFAVYQVILYIPGYITKVRELFESLATKIMGTSGAYDLISNFISENRMRVSLGDELTQAKTIDFLYALKPSQWLEIQDAGVFSALKSEMVATATQSQKVNYFLGINISEAPWDVIRNGFSSIKGGSATGAIVLAMLIGILIPVLAWFTQWLNYKLMPQSGTKSENNMASQMQTMNTVMPIFSAFICLTLSMGIGIYWIVGAVIRIIQQVVINRKIGKLDIDNLVAQAQAKQAEKGYSEKRTSSSTAQNQRRRTYEDPHGNRARNIQDTEQYYTQSDKISPDSITAKANMVRSLDSRGGKKGSEKK